MSSRVGSEILHIYRILIAVNHSLDSFVEFNGPEET